jgi:uncharacterized membrane protein HdeD (DUF308 family)
MADELAAELSAGLRRIWWLPVLRGAILVVLGVLMLAHPINTVHALAWVFGVFTVIDGVVSLVHWWINRSVDGSMWWLATGAAEIVIGVVVMAWPTVTVNVVFYLITIWILVLGILGIIGAVTLYRARDISWYWVLTLGLVSFLFGLLLLVNKQTSLTVIIVILGLFAFVAGVVLIVSGFATRSLAQQIAPAQRT